MRGRYGKTKSAASKALLEAAEMLETRGRPRKRPGKDRPYMSEDLWQYSLPAAIDYAGAAVTRTAKAVAAEALLTVADDEWPTLEWLNQGFTQAQTIELLDNCASDTRECARYLRRAAQALAA
jgi:hypothetical protein